MIACCSWISNFHNFYLNNISYYLDSSDEELPFKESLNTSIFRATNVYQKFIKKFTLIVMKKYLRILIAIILYINHTFLITRTDLQLTIV
jgi:hypothetical protein